MSRIERSWMGLVVPPARKPRRKRTRAPREYCDICDGCGWHEDPDFKNFIPTGEGKNF